MKVTPLLRGSKFGQLAWYRNIVEIKLSSHELDPMKGFFTRGFPNLCRRFMDQVFYIAPPVIATYCLYTWAENENARLSRKNPRDFENDE